MNRAISKRIPNFLRNLYLERNLPVKCLTKSGLFLEFLHHAVHRLYQVAFMLCSLCRCEWKGDSFDRMYNEMDVFKKVLFTGQKCLYTGENV